MKVDEQIRQLPKAEIHVHVEGTMTPSMAKHIATRNGVAIDPSLFDPDGINYNYKNFLDLVTVVYQAVADAMRTRADYAEVTYDYLRRCAQDNTLYVELIACPGQCARTGISYKDMIDGIADGIDRAQKEFDIESRINITFERHRPGVESEKDADLILSYPHPYVVGLDIAGGEKSGDLGQFAAPFQRVMNNFPRPLGSRLHAGEGAGPENMRDAITLFAPTRIGHGVRAMEDEGIIDIIKKKGIVLEVCPTSNILLMPQYGGDIKKHPLRELFEKGVKVTLNSDDPGMFGDCTLTGEYQIAHDEFGFSLPELLQVTRTTIESSYADRETRKRLLKVVDDYKITP